ncbi:MAG: pilus assembly protein CpaE [Homoserinimonas sp.]|jgi:hypothetical protein|nr:pilus assembly protein CpaE [Homoserinimonas sp.]
MPSWADAVHDGAGTTEWVLDSVAVENRLWLPREDQVRERLGDASSSSMKIDGAFTAEVVLATRLGAEVSGIRQMPTVLLAKWSSVTDPHPPN